GVSYGLVEGQRHHWGRALGPVAIPVVIAAGAMLLAAFVLWERRQPEPLLPLELFRDRNFTLATLLSLITTFGLFGLLLVFVLETQTVLGMSPLRSGLAALPWTVTLSAVAPVAGRLTDRIGGRVLLLAGLAAFALGVLGLAVLPTTRATAATLAGPLVVVGIGMGLTIAPTTTEAMRGIPPERTGAASGVLNTARQVGAALGAAVVGAGLQNRLGEGRHREAAGRAGGRRPAAGGGGPFRGGFGRGGPRRPAAGRGGGGGGAPAARPARRSHRPGHPPGARHVRRRLPVGEPAHPGRGGRPARGGQRAGRLPDKPPPGRPPRRRALRC